MDNKLIARYSLSFIGGTPKVVEYLNGDNSRKVDIMICTDQSSPDQTVYATIGLSATDIGQTVGDTTLRTELMMAGTSDEIFANILSSAAFVVQEVQDCGFGMIIHDVVSQYSPESELHHVILMAPAFWPAYAPLKDEETTIAWLLAVPITEAERQLIQTEGIDVFDKLLAEKNVDISNLKRESVC